MPWSPIAHDRPAWMRVRAASPGSRYDELDGIIRSGGLVTVCEEARCPNIGECWTRGTATFQIMGETCTRACRYCAVDSGRPEPLDPLEPAKLAAAAARMDLEHVVVTSVDRDDLPDRGAAHFAATIRALRRRLPRASVEILTPDFLGDEEAALRTVLAARPDVFNHNIETCRRIQPMVRPKGDYDRALRLLQRAKELWHELGYASEHPLLTKSGLIAGMGESDEELVATMRDLRGHDVDVVTVGQYLQPTEHHLPLDRWVPLSSFRRLRDEGEAMGFGSVFAGPLVRSSYRAEEQRLAASGAIRAAAL